MVAICTQYTYCVLYIWSPPITELMLSQMLLWQGDRGRQMLNILSAPQSDKIPPNLPIPRSMNGNSASQNLLIMYYPKILKHTTQAKKKSLHQSNFWKWPNGVVKCEKGCFYIECFFQSCLELQRKSIMRVRCDMKGERKQTSNKRRGLNRSRKQDS